MSPQSLSLAKGIENRNRDADGALEDLRRLRDTGSIFPNGGRQPGDMLMAAGDLAACSVLPGFNQAEFADLLAKRSSAWDMEVDVGGPLRRMGGGVYFQIDLMLLRLLTGEVQSAQREWAVRACRYVLNTDQRPEWTQRSWKNRVWTLTSSVLEACYWLGARDLATEALEKAWMPGAKSAKEWADVPDVWTRKRMEWLDFAFWRSWWVSEVGLCPGEHLDRGRVLSHAVFLFGDAQQINATLADYVAMTHAHLHAGKWPMQIREVVESMLMIESRPWK